MERVAQRHLIGINFHSRWKPRPGGVGAPDYYEGRLSVFSFHMGKIRTTSSIGGKYYGDTKHNEHGACGLHRVSGDGGAQCRDHREIFRDTGRFAAWLEGAEATRERTAAWRDSLLEGGYAPVTVNSMVAAVNQFFAFLGWEDCKVKALKIQRKLFRDDRRELTREEYQRLLDAAHGLGRERLALLLETICATGIRVSEVKYITVEAAQAGRAEISLKGKLRTILLPGKLCRKLKKVCQGAKNRLR